jgi:hypothetical protein
MTRVLVLSLLLSSTIHAQDVLAPPHKVAAESKCGKYRLRLERASQSPSPWNSGIAAISLDFEMDFGQAGMRNFERHLPQDTYLENADPFVAARINLVEIGKNKHFGWTDNFSPSVTVSDLELGSEQKQLDSLTLKVTVVRIKTWETVRFTGVGQGKSDFLQCGPFQLVVHGETDQVRVAAAAYSDFAAETAEYHKRVPLSFVNHRYAMDHMTITDATKKPLTYIGYGGSGGSTVGHFHRRGGIEVDSPREPIPYPLQVEVRLPKEYETERVGFEFKDLPLPALKKGR